ncbi:reverse transcriptase family protein [Neisseria sicca]|uniref:reverse transcriptase family protein n=1 Tax=Neisseria sicca TaxID=490 RepID=UPI003C735AD5
MSERSSFCYPYKPIASLEKLAICLNITLEELNYLQENADSFYFLTAREQKKDGSFRECYDVKKRLKDIHEKISIRFLKLIEYPEYLQGGIKKRDYISNASQHTCSFDLIEEDISNFYPSISREIIYQVWVGFFRFSHEVADCLSKLVTFQGYLVQGSKVSGLLCNLILWNRETKLVMNLKRQGLTYTRYVDDVTVSCDRYLSNKEKQQIIRKIYALFYTVGAKPNRRKHKIERKGTRQTVNNLNVTSENPTLPKEQRNKIRAAVFECEKIFRTGNSPLIQYKELFESTKGRVNQLKRFHKKQANSLLKRLEEIHPNKFKAT